MLCDGVSAVTEIPRERFNPDAFYHPDHNRVDAVNTRRAHLVKGDVAAFDAPFFGISREEASVIDPQQRGLLEVTYRALESGKILHLIRACYEDIKRSSIKSLLTSLS